ATPVPAPLSLHDALPISGAVLGRGTLVFTSNRGGTAGGVCEASFLVGSLLATAYSTGTFSMASAPTSTKNFILCRRLGKSGTATDRKSTTSELQSRENLV